MLQNDCCYKHALSPARGGILTLKWRSRLRAVAVCKSGALACARCPFFYKSALSPRRGAQFVVAELIVVNFTSQD